MRKLIFNILLVTLLIAQPCYSKGKDHDQTRSNPANYVNVDFDNIPLSEVIFMVSEFTGTGFVYNDPNPITVTWSQRDIFQGDLVSTFIRVVSELGYVCTPLDRGSNAYSIKPPGNSDTLRLVKLSTITRMNQDRPDIAIFWDGNIYGLDDFPYKVIFRRNDLYSMIPAHLIPETSGDLLQNNLVAELDGVTNEDI